LGPKTAGVRYKMLLMRNLWLLTFLATLFAFQVTAQVKVKNKDIRRATEDLVSRYQLDKSQTSRMTDIQEQRLTNLASIEVLKQRDYTLYLQKKRAIRLYVEAATRWLLRQEQLKTFEKLQAQRLKEKEALLQKLKNKNADQQERRLTLLQLEESWE
jgi:hypothetical protein